MSSDADPEAELSPSTPPAADLSEVERRIAGLETLISQRSDELTDIRSALRTIDAQVRAFVSASEGPSDAQLATIIQLLEGFRSRLSTIESKVATDNRLLDRLSAIESAIDAPPGTGIFDRLNEIETALTSRSDREVLSRLAALSESIANPSEDSRMVDRLDAIERRLAALEGSDLGSRIDSISAAVSALPNDEMLNRLRGLEEQLSSTVDFDSRLSSIDGAVDSLLQQHLRAGHLRTEQRVLLGEHAASLVALNAKIDAVVQQVNSVIESAPDPNVVSGTRADVGAVAEAVAALKQQLDATVGTVNVLATGLQILPGYGEQLTRIDERLDAIPPAVLTEIDAKLDAIRPALLAEIDSKLGTLAQELLARLDDRLGVLVQTQLSQLEERLAAVSDRVGHQIDERAGDLSQRLVALDGKANQHEQRLLAVANAVGELPSFGHQLLKIQQLVEGSEQRAAEAAQSATAAAASSAAASEQRLRAHVDDAIVELARMILPRLTVEASLLPSAAPDHVAPERDAPVPAGHESAASDAADVTGGEHDNSADDEQSSSEEPAGYPTPPREETPTREA